MWVVYLSIAALVVGLVMDKVNKKGSFSVVDAEEMPRNYEDARRVSPAVEIIYSQPGRSGQMKLLVVKCDRCGTEWNATNATFEPSVMLPGHAGWQPTEARFLVTCPSENCGYTGEVTRHRINKFLKRKKKQSPKEPNSSADSGREG